MIGTEVTIIHEIQQFIFSYLHPLDIQLEIEARGDPIFINLTNRRVYLRCENLKLRETTGH